MRAKGRAISSAALAPRAALEPIAEPFRKARGPILTPRA
jgi:hypothetical protein